MSNAGYTLDGFKEHAAMVGRHFGQRRSVFLKQLKFRCLVAAILLFTFPFWYSLLTRWDALGGGISSIGVLVVNVLAAISIIIIIGAFALRPMFRYRYDTLNVGNTLPGATGVVNQPVRLKSRIFTKLLSYFGDFNMFEDRKLSLRRFQNAPNLPMFDIYDASDYVRGHIDGVRVELCEASLYTQREGESQRIFHGLFILLDINDSHMVLRGKFFGETVLMLSNDMPNDILLAKYDGYQRVALPDSNFGQQVKAVSTNLEEADRLLSGDFIRGGLKLTEALKQVKNQDQSVDDKVVLALEKIATGLGDVLASAGSLLLHWFKTGSFRQQSARHVLQREIAKAQDDSHWFSGGAQCCFFDDKILISLPTSHNLFEPDSLFHPPLTEEDIQLSYSIMSILSDMTKAVIECLPKEMVA